MRPLTDFSVVEHRSAESGGMKFDPSWLHASEKKEKRLLVKLAEGLVMTVNRTRL